MEDSDDTPYNYVQNTTLAIGSRRAGRPPQCWENFDVVVNCTLNEYEDNKERKGYLHLKIAEGKKGQNALFDCIPTALEFVRQPLSEGKRVLIHCAKGQDRSVGIALAVLVAFYDPQDGRWLGDRVPGRLVYEKAWIALFIGRRM